MSLPQLITPAHSTSEVQPASLTPVGSKVPVSHCAVLRPHLSSNLEPEHVEKNQFGCFGGKQQRAG